jgi:hypothetical protein
MTFRFPPHRKVVQIKSCKIQKSLAPNEGRIMLYPRVASFSIQSRFVAAAGLPVARHFRARAKYYSLQRLEGLKQKLRRYCLGNSGAFVLQYNLRRIPAPKMHRVAARILAHNAVVAQP